MRRLALVLVAGSVACSGEEIVRVDWPDFGSARSVLVLTETPTAVTGRGARTDELPPISSTSSFQELTLFVYDESLEETRLPDGPIDPSMGERRADETHFDRLLGFDEESLSWQERKLSDLSEKTRGFMVPGGVSCSVERESIPLPRGSGVRTMLELPSDQVFVQTLEEGMVVSADGTHRAISTATITTASHRTADGALLFGGQRGEVYSGELTDELSLTRIARSPRAEPVRFLAGDLEVLYVLTSSGSLERWDGEWQLLHSFDPPLGGASAKGGLVPLDDGRVLAAFATSSEVIIVDDRARSEKVSGDLSSGITAVSQVDEVGVVAAAGVSGRFFVREEESWRELDRADFALDVLAIASVADGFVFGGNFGGFGRWSSTDGHCPVEQVTGQSVRFIARLKDRFVVSGEPPSRGQASEVVLLLAR